MKEPKCPHCGAAVTPSRQPCKVLPFGTETVGYGGEITDVRFTDDGHTVLHVRLDDSEHSFTHWRVRIIECE